MIDDAPEHYVLKNAGENEQFYAGETSNYSPLSRPFIIGIESSIKSDSHFPKC